VIQAQIVHHSVGWYQCIEQWSEDTSA
jgi:hypothetical protein